MIKTTLEASEHLPVARRVKVLRGLADVCGDSREAARLKDLADSLHIADANCREFNFKFVQSNQIP